MAKNMALANIARVDIITEETTPRLITCNTGTEASVEPYISEGTETPLRVKNQILAQNNTENLVMGYDATLKDVVFSPETFALIDGGTVTNATSGTKDFESYEGPTMGAVISRTPFTMDIWTEEKSGSGDTASYMRWRFKGCKGAPIKFSFTDGEFYAPEYTIKSRPNIGEKPVSVRKMSAMPAENATAAQVLAWTGEEG